MITFRSRKSNQIHPTLDETLSGVFSEHELAAMSRLGTILTVDADTVVGREGEPGREVFVILDGEALVLRSGDAVAEVGAGTVIGEMSVLDGTPRNASLIASTELQVAVFSSREFADLLEQCPRLDGEVRRVADERKTAAA